MLQVAQNYKTGKITLEEVDPPALKSAGAIIRTHFSVISAGTEGMKVREAKMSLIEKARARPDQVKKVLETARQQGLTSTYQKVMNRLDSLTPLGYALSGTIEAVGDQASEFEVGQRVACAGAGYANHAEFNYTPKNLIVPVPDTVTMEHAAFATIGSIALHGFRQSDMRLGETAVVIGLGLIGQVLVQVLKAAGMQVFGTDLAVEKCELAVKCGALDAGAPDDASWQNALKRATGQAGADCVFLTVGTSSNEPVELATALLRDRGRMIAIGKTKLDLDYNSFFKKEIDVCFSRSYGPGRYDTNYEEKGQDYPIGYVRWTEGRNLSAFLNLIASGSIDLEPIIAQTFEFSQAVQVYEDLHAGTLEGIGILFSFGQDVEFERKATSPIATEGKKLDQVRLGMIGAGNYASSMLFPHLKRDKRAAMKTVATASALSAANAQNKFGFEAQGTDYKSIISDDNIDALMITTNHKTHAAMVSEGLLAGKTVFVEKPLAIDQAGLDQVIAAAETSKNDRVMAGFNRRFSPIIKDLKQKVSGSPLTMIYRVHAGAMGGDSWLSDPDEGSRFIGEAGHFLDVFSFLTNARPVSVSGAAQRPQNPSSDDLENITLTVRYEDGSVGTLIYLTQGSGKIPKEHLEVFGGGETLVMDNFTTLLHYTFGGKIKKKTGYGGDKGQKGEMDAFISACKSGGLLPLSFEELCDLTKLTIEGARAALNSQTTPL